MRRLRTLTFGLILAVPALVPAVAGSAPACAAEASGASHAALVVNTGSQTTTYCVALDASSVTDEDRVPCRACGQGSMVVSELMIH